MLRLSYLHPSKLPSAGLNAKAVNIPPAFGILPKRKGHLEGDLNVCFKNLYPFNVGIQKSLYLWDVPLFYETLKLALIAPYHLLGYQLCLRGRNTPHKLFL